MPTPSVRGELVGWRDGFKDKFYRKPWFLPAIVYTDFMANVCGDFMKILFSLWHGDFMDIYICGNGDESSEMEDRNNCEIGPLRTLCERSDS